MKTAQATYQLQALTPASFVEILRERAINQPHKVAYTFLEDGETEEINLTYGELDRKARFIGALLQNLGLTGERALLLYPPGLDFVTAFFGCLYAGVVAVPAYPPRRNQSLDRLQAIVKDCQAKEVLTTTSVWKNIERSCAENPEFASMRWLATDNLSGYWDKVWKEPAIDSDSLAFLQYTSGSTGTPKGVMVSHGNLVHNSRQIHQAFGHNSKSRGVIWLPLYHDMGLIGGVLQPLYGGFPVTLMSPLDLLQKPLRWLQAISKYQATTSGGPNFAYDLCLKKISPEQRDSLDLSSWQVAFSGAEPVRAETLEQFAEYFAPCGFRKEAFYPCYGMAESTLFIAGGLKQSAPVIQKVDGSALEQNQVVAPTEEKEDNQTLVGCGYPRLDQKVVIAHPESLTKCAEGEVGEIWVSGSSVAKGYWNRPEQTKETFEAYLADTQEGPFLRTGDLGFLLDGELFVTGRCKDVIIIRGRNHYPQDIERTVAESNSVLRAGYGAAFATKVNGEERLVVVQEVERTALRRLDVDQVIGDIRQALTGQHGLQVHAVLLIKTGSIPKTSSGKIQRFACRAKFEAGTLEVVGSDKREVKPFKPRASRRVTL